MSQNLQLNPVLKDYVFVNGSPVPSDRVLEASYYAIMIPQNNWLYGNPNQGSLLYTLQNAKRTGSIEQQFAAFVNDAINRQVIQTGQAIGVETNNIATSRTGTSNQINVIPSAVSISNQFTFNPI